MRTYNIHEAKTHLSRLIELAAHGTSFVIAKAGRPMVKVIPFDSEDASGSTRIGFMRGEIKVPADFDSMGAAEIADLFGAQS